MWCVSSEAGLSLLLLLCSLADAYVVSGDISALIRKQEETETLQEVTSSSHTHTLHYRHDLPSDSLWDFTLHLGILAYAGKTGNVSITDYPDQSIFTVRWDKLEISDSGYYWCAVEIGGYGTVDAGYYLYLTVQSAPGVYVKNSSVSGHEGDNVSVQCFYTSGYKDKLKQWCRYKDKSCYTGKRTDTSQNPSVQISDDGGSSFTVLMTGLRLSDSGWYFCSVGDLQAPVQLTVNEPKPVTHIPTTTPSDPETDK
ncbi:unnamed protein product [Leuciscus chuanchicus]